MAETENWYFEQSGSRHGPVTLETLLSFLKSKMVTGDTPCLESGSRQRVEAARVRFIHKASRRRQTRSPPLPKSTPKASSFFAWTIALVPIVGGFIQMVLAADGALPREGAVLCVYFVVYTILCTLDSNHIKNSRASSDLPIRWFWLVPVYLYKRARILRQPLTYLWAWVIALFIGALMTQTDWLSKEVYWGTGLPACDNDTIKGKVSSIFAEVRSSFRPLEGGALRIEQIPEPSSTEKERACKALIYSSRALRYQVSYKITDIGSDLYVEIDADSPK